MFNINDSITYNITIKNDSEEDYYFTKNSFNLDSDYLEYSLLNASETIKSNEEKTIQLKITYKNKIPEDSYNENKQMTITLGDEPLTNPDTKVQYIIIILISLITSILFFISKKKSMKLLGILLISLIPIGAKALCSINLEINADITINEKEAIFLPGPEVNTKMKELAGDDTSTQSYQPNFLDENIGLIKCSKAEPIDQNKEEKNIVSMSDSQYPIYMWYEEETIYWWSESKRPKLNENASYMFNNLTKLEKIENMENIDTSETKNAQFMFHGDSNMSKINGVEKWDTSNITNLDRTFSQTSLASLETLKEWDVSKVENMKRTFEQTKLENLDGLENWNVSRVKDMESMFYFNTNLTSIDALSSWDTQNVETLSQIFALTKISNLEPLKNWNVSNVKNMMSVFYKVDTIKSAEPLKKWDTSNVTTMLQMFLYTDLTNLHGLENWNVSKVINFHNTFSNNTNLVDASAINNWDIQSTVWFKNMFYNTPVHHEFTKVQGTWDSSGTFIPS